MHGGSLQPEEFRVGDCSKDRALLHAVADRRYGTPARVRKPLRRRPKRLCLFLYDVPEFAIS